MSETIPKDCVAVLGGANRYSDTQIIAAFQIGREIGRCGKALITGATTGIPYAAAMGAKLSGTAVIGISPAADVEEHISTYKKPISYLDAIVFTGMGLEGRNPINVRSVKGAIFIAGEFGTLNEFSAACAIGNKVLGIMERSGGISTFISGALEHLPVRCDTRVIVDNDPIRLARRVCDEVDQRYSFREYHAAGDDLGNDVRDIVRRFVETENNHLDTKVFKP